MAFLSGSTSRCCYVENCSNGDYHLRQWQQKHIAINGRACTVPCSCTPPFELYTFPTKKRDPDRRHIWLTAIKRADKHHNNKLREPSACHRVCSRHFLDGKPTGTHPDPELHLNHKRVLHTSCTRTETAIKRAKIEIDEEETEEKNVNIIRSVFGSTSMANQSEAVPLVVKFGGSAITNKGQLETLKPEALREAAQIIQKCTERNRCIVVHGAGSFGHHQAKQYNINTGFAHLESNAAHQTRMGFCRTHQSVAKLNACVVDYLLDCDIPAVPCSPCGSWLTSDLVVTSSGLQTVKELLAAGFVPVLHGDTVRDTQLGGSILSGDTIIKHICETFTVDRVVFLSDVSGIYDKPPQLPGATLLLRIRVKRDGTLATCVSTSTPRHDVTGGIKLKLHTAMDIVRNTNGRTKVFVCRLGSETAHRLCLGEDRKEDNPDGTEVCLESIVKEPLNDHDYV